MIKRIIWLLTLASFTFFSIHCATTAPYTLPRGISSPQRAKFIATRFPEVKLWTNKGDLYQGKMTVLEGDTLTFSPYPYWNVEPIRVEVTDIERIELTRQKQGAGKGFAYGFSVGWLVLGALGGAGSKYNTDFQSWMELAPLGGLTIGLIGLIGGALGDLGSPTKFEIHRLPYDDKIRTLAHLMGLRPALKK